jgi:hypothetical protein
VYYENIMIEKIKTVRKELTNVLMFFILGVLMVALAVLIYMDVKQDY